jgi:hypothetical protein
MTMTTNPTIPSGAGARRILPTSSLAAVALAVFSVTGVATAQEFIPNHLFVANFGGNSVVEFNETGTQVRVIPTGNSTKPWGIAFGPNGHMYVTCTSLDAVREFDGAGNIVNTFGQADLDFPEGIALGPNGNVFVASFTTNRVVEFTPGGTKVRSFGAGTTLSGCDTVVIGIDGHIWTTSFNTNEVMEFAQDGTFLRKFGPAAGLGGPNAMVQLPNGHLLVTSVFTSSIFEFDSNGNKVTEFGNAAGVAAGFGITVGPDSNLYVGTAGANVVRLTTTGSAVGNAINDAALTGAAGVAFAPFRFTANITGTLSLLNDGTAKAKETATCSYSPGTQTLLVQLVDSPTSSLDLVSIYTNTAMVFHGNEIPPPDPKKPIAFAGTEIGARAIGEGASDTVALITTKLDAPTLFKRVTKIASQIIRTSPVGIANLKITSTKLLK